MPTYEYQCDACGHKFDKFQSIKADPIRACPQCRKNKVRRLISTGAGLIFKGSGFYITDYRDKSYTDKAKSESGASGDGKPSETKPAEAGAATASTKSEPAPAAKTEAKPATAPAPAPRPKGDAPKKKK